MAFRLIQAAEPPYEYIVVEDTSFGPIAVTSILLTQSGREMALVLSQIFADIAQDIDAMYAAIEKPAADLVAA